MSIRFYVSWYLGDPVYPAYASDCGLLLSPTSLSRDWTVRNLSTLPSCLILDSGGYRYSNSSERRPSAASLLERQLAIMGDAQIPTLVCPLDSPVGLGTPSVAKVDEQVAHTLAHAFELQRLIDRVPLPPHVEPLAIVQGNDPASLTYCAHELLSMGYRHFGVGSLARVPDKMDVIRRISAVYTVVRRPLHLFGIGSPHFLRQIEASWVASVDSSLPAKAAACNELLYSHPFRRYGIMTQDGVSRSKLPVHRCITEALDCSCPICITNRSAVVQFGRRNYIRARAVHNYHHLRLTIEGRSPTGSSSVSIK